MVIWSADQTPIEKVEILFRGTIQVAEVLIERWKTTTTSFEADVDSIKVTFTS
jgi:hypothetical protein